MSRHQAENIWKNAELFTERACSAGSPLLTTLALIVVGDLVHPEDGIGYWKGKSERQASLAKSERDALVDATYGRVIQAFEEGDLNNARGICEQSLHQCIFICDSEAAVTESLRELGRKGVSAALSDSNLNVAHGRCMTTFTEEYSDVINASW